MSFLVLEKSAHDEFFAKFKTGQFSGQRLGQAFVNHFNLHEVVQYKSQLDQLYELDGDRAKAKIRELFYLQ